MRTILFIVGYSVLLFAPVRLSAQQKNYYMTAAGNDAQDGLSKQTAWRSIERMNKQDFKPGDSILLEGGIIFDGTIHLTAFDSGSDDMPVTLSSFGKGKAIVNAANGDGVLAINTAHFTISSLHFVGAGVYINRGSGIHFYANDSLHAPTRITITDCDVNGFRGQGIVFGANENISWKGYRHVRIVHCNVTENGEAGISSYGGNGFQHQDFYIAWCKAFQNRGNLSKPDSHTGNGIVMAKIDGLLIEYCEAFGNGSDNRSTAGGPVGIWVWMCRNAIIQYCSSHDNYAGATKDGGGFDIDGGASDCILQYNYSYNNEGAGYLLAEFGASFPFTNNTIRFNISINDGRKNSYGAITVWGAGKNFPVTNTAIYNNTIYVDDKKIIDGKPAAITLLGPHFKNVVMANNIVVTKGNVNLIASDTTVNTFAFMLLHNNYYSYSNQYIFQLAGKKIMSLVDWFSLYPDQEKWNGKSLLLNKNPLFEYNQKFTQLFTPIATAEFLITGLVLSQSSSLRKEKFPLREHFKILSNTRDYTNTIIPVNGWVIPGACVR
ncbi:MAG TPA: right-handed parallel beta-helix repeat-containing protein [Flavitalea sp.]|nr:right-handed parallel beta-helix repeat-containing protein [Flavitalea sp.]